MKTSSSSANAPLKDTLCSESYCKIPISEFMATKSIPSDVYIQVGKERFVKVAHKGSTIDLERVKTYRDGEVKHLFITVEDFRAYVGFSLNVAQAASQRQVDETKKVKILKHTLESITQISYLDCVQPVVLESASQILTDTVKAVSDNNDLLELLLTFEAHANWLYSHTVAVSVFTSMIALKMGWTSTQSLFKVALCSLFHDIGKKDIEECLLTKKRAFLTSADIKLIESHTSRGRDFLANIPSLPIDVVKVAYQHHENINGTGYPNRLRAAAIDPLARLVHVADLFVNLVMPSTSDAPKLTPEMALKKMAELYTDEMDPEFFRCLTLVFRLEWKAEAS